MKEHQLLVSQIKHLKAKRPTRPKPKASRPNEYWGIDMTKVMIPSSGWVYLVVVLDWYTKKIVGHTLRIQSKSRDWLDALNSAVIDQFPDGIRNHRELSLVSDNGSQPASESFMKGCSELGIRQIFASYDNPKGNADTERVIRTIKEDFVWPRQWDSLFEFEESLADWVDRYNTDYPHSAIGYLTPQQFEDISKNTGCLSLTNFTAP